MHLNSASLAFFSFYLLNFTFSLYTAYPRAGNTTLLFMDDFNDPIRAVKRMMELGEASGRASHLLASTAAARFLCALPSPILRCHCFCPLCAIPPARPGFALQTFRIRIASDGLTADGGVSVGGAGTTSRRLLGASEAQAESDIEAELAALDGGGSIGGGWGFDEGVPLLPPVSELPLMRQVDFWLFCAFYLMCLVMISILL